MGSFVEGLVYISDDFIKLNFRKTDGVNVLQDAIAMSRDLYESMSESDIEALKQQRFDKWLASIAAAQAAAEETPQDPPEEPLEEVVETPEE